jgi:hypothetical protein
VASSFIGGHGYRIPQRGDGYKPNTFAYIPHWAFSSPFLALIVLTVVGYVLFLVKTKKLIVYAYGEILFALTSCYVAMLRSRDGLSVGTATVLMASAYIVVRGLENRHKAISARTRPPK